MKSTGVARNLDTLGRITVPKEIRNQLEITGDTPLEMLVDKDGIYLKVYKIKCVFCDRHTDNEALGKRVCKECLEKLKGE